MATSRRRQVRSQAHDRCEYCQMPQACTVLPHEIDHIRAQKHHGSTELQNLCWACAGCNGHKGSNVAGYDPDTGELVPLFNPRRDKWSDHFAWDGAVLQGLTANGRATIDVLQINHFDRVAHRQLLIALDVFPDA